MQFLSGCALLLATLSVPSRADETVLRYGILETMGYPFVRINAQGAIHDGVLFELGKLLAKQMKVDWVVVPLSRNRVDPYLLRGRVDVVCYQSPQWTVNADQLQWSIPNLTQVERVVSRQGMALTADPVKTFTGRQVSLQLGYLYPSLQPLFDGRQAVRKDETNVDQMFKSLELEVSDLLVTPESEIYAYFHANPEKRARFQVSKAAFTVTPTQCAIGPNARVSKSQVDTALASLQSDGSIDRLAQKFAVSPR
jgi:polar amino acid transport system substrate-binding protein